MRQSVQRQIPEVQTVHDQRANVTSINPSTRCASQTTRRVRWPTVAVGSGCAALMLSLGAQGDSFARAYYDSRTDQLVVGMIYGGTNAKHAFTLRWGSSVTSNEPSSAVATPTGRPHT